MWYYGLCLATLFSFCHGAGQSWSYKGIHGVSHWADDYSLCSSNNPRQSPVNIVQAETLYQDNLDPISLRSDEDVTFTVTNNGHTGQIDAVCPVVAVLDGSISVEGGGLDDKYVSHSLHFHWGSQDDIGSEHTVNDISYPLEMHIVNYDASTYGSLGEAAPQTDGLAVLGVFFQVSSDDNIYLQPLLDAISAVSDPEASGQEVTGLNLNDLLPMNTAEFYRYLGSLTTPPCYESVVWTVFRMTASISQTQLDIFRQVLSTSGVSAEALVDNYRNTQPLHERHVLRSFSDPETEDIVVHHDETQKPPKPHQWGYSGHEGPSHWHEQYAACDSNSPRQSPVDIVVSETLAGGDDLGDVDFVSNIKEGDKITFSNNGHTVMGRVNGEMSMVGAGLGDVYRTHSFHFHWGESSDIGSEHTVDGLAFPLELHIVHYDSERAADLGAALSVENGLAVLGILFTVGGDNNTALYPIVEALRAVRQPKSGTFDIDHFDLSTLLPVGTEQYYRYEGSLTTPPCSPVVVWTVLSNPQTVSASQMEEFRQLLTQGDVEASLVPLVDNFRPVQPLDTRKVTKSFALSPAVRVVNPANEGPPYNTDNNDDNAGQTLTLYTSLCVLMALLAAALTS